MLAFKTTFVLGWIGCAIVAASGWWLLVNVFRWIIVSVIA